MIFRSKVDWWFTLIILGSTCLMLFPFFYFWENFDTISYGGVFRVLLLIVIVFFGYYTMWLQFFNTKYAIFEDKIFIQCGFYRKAIILSSIVLIKSMKSFSSSPALSVDRVYIKYCVNGLTEEVFISPKNKTEFINIISGRI